MSKSAGWQRRPYNWSEEPPNWSVFRSGPKGRKRWFRYWVRDVINGCGDYLMVWLLGAAGVSVCPSLGGWLGRRAGARSMPGRNRKVRAYLSEIRPNWEDAAIESCVARMWDGVGRAHAEFAVIDRMLPEGRVTISGRDHLDRAKRDGRAVLVVSVHIGNWEIQGQVLASEGLVPHAIYQPPTNRFRHAIAVSSRLRTPHAAELLPPGRRSGPAAMRRLRDGGCVLMSVDECVHGKVYGPVPGRKTERAGNIIIAARLAVGSGALIVPVWCERLPGPFFNVHFEPIVECGRALSGQARDREIDSIVESLDAVFRPIIDAHIDQWFMLHEIRV